MYIFVIGALVFIFFDYSFIFGAFGFARLGFNGSAYASVCQSIIMSIAAAIFVLCDNRYKEYEYRFIWSF